MTIDRTFDWVPRFDEKSRDYPVRATIRVANIRKRNKLWKLGSILDQGREGACVGFGWSADALSAPTVVDLNRVKAVVPRNPQEFAKFVYHTAQTLDTFPGESYEGTSVLAGAKTMSSLGLLKEYRWAFSVEDVVDAILSIGPVVLGIEWHAGMYNAPNGVLTPEGPVVGGHCITAVGYTYKSTKLNGEDGVILQNSWGADWGVNGLAEISVSNLKKLLDNNGEACIPYRRSYGR